MTCRVGLSPKDCTISVKLGGQVIAFSANFSGCVDTCSKIVCLPGVVGVEVVGAITVMGMVRGLECSRRGVVQKEPLE